MKATIYRPMSNRQETAAFEAGMTVAEAFPGIDLENAIVLVNGRTAGADHALREDDTVTIREMPGSSWDDWTFGILTGGIYNIIKGGVEGYKAREAAERANRELEDLKRLTNSSVDNRPFLRGATNTVAKGNSQPYICGRHLLTPYLLCSPFYKLAGRDGADEYTYTALECGFNRQIIDTVSIDDIRIKKFSDKTPQEGSYSLDGGQVFADDGLLEISQDGGLLTALPELNYKVVSKACNDEIPRDSRVADGRAEHLTYTLDANAMTVDVAITFPYGLYAYNDSNDKMETEVTITPQYSLDGGIAWINFRFNYNGKATNTFRDMASKRQLRYCAHKEFSLDDYRALRANGQDRILLRVRSGGNDDDRIKNDCYVLYHQSVCFDTAKSSLPAGTVDDNGTAGLVPCKVVEDRERAFCTILGLRVKATANNEDKLQRINIITQGVARTWDGGRWSEGRSATRNPAAWALEILTSGSHPASRFEDPEIDMESLGDLYEYCEENEFHFDHVIATNTRKSGTLGAIMEACGATLYWDMYGRISVAIDMPQENATAVYNPQNIISISNRKTFGRRTDGLRVKYITSYNDLYSEETYLLMREGRTLDQDSVIKDVTVTGITTHKHIVRYARRLMAMEALRPKTTTIEVGNEGVYLTPYSKVLLQDDSLKIGLGSATIKSTEWFGGTLRRIVLNEPVTFTDKACGIIVSCYGSNRAVPVPLKVGGGGTTDTLEVLTAYSVGNEARPEAGNVVSFGELDINGEFSRITTEHVITSISRSDGGYRLELANYDEAMYDSGAIPEYRSNITMRPGAGKGEIAPDYATRDDVDDAVNKAVEGFETNADAANELAELVTGGVNFSSTHHITPANRERLERTVNLEMLQQRLDEFLSESNNALSVTRDALTIEMEDAERGLRTTIQQTAEQILAQADDMEREIRGLLSVQAGAVQAMVEGGGSAGRMALSLELPAMLTAARRDALREKFGADIDNIYARLKGTEYYTIRGDASQAQVAAMWERMRAAGLLASQFQVDADQISFGGTTVFSANKTSSLVSSAANEAAKDAAGKVSESKDALARGLGYADYSALESAAKNKQTIIDGGYIRTALIKADALAAEIAKIDQVISKKIQSDNYQHGKSGFMLDGATGEAHLEGNTHIGGNCTIDGKGIIGADITINGFLNHNGAFFAPFAVLNISYNDSTLKLVRAQNIKLVTRDEKGVYTVWFKNPQYVPTQEIDGFHYINLFVIGNCHDTFKDGFQNPIIPSVNWVRNYVNGRLELNDRNEALLKYCVLYGCDNNSDSLQDFYTAQIFFFITEAT